MKKSFFIRNKYTLSVLILLVCIVAADICLHKGMTRVMFGDTFTDQRSPHNFGKCEQPLTNIGKRWKKAVNTVEKMKHLSPATAGFEMDVYFDTAKNRFDVYHDISAFSNLDIEAILKLYRARNLTSSIWLDFKNLSSGNEKKSLNYIMYLRKKYDLQSKIIVESSLPQYLQSFCDSGFFTCYYTPFFNPYLLSQSGILKAIDTISVNLKKYPTTALSGYYFQYPLLKKFFPNYPLLIWAEHREISVVSILFNRMVQQEDRVKIILQPF